MHYAPGFPAPQEPGLFENPQVLGEARERHRKGLGELADRGAPRGQALEDPAAGGIGERREESIEGRVLIFNH